VLLVLCTIFVLLGFLQGPKLATAIVDTSAVVAKSGQQLRIFTNQPIAALASEQVTITPAVAHSVTTTGDLIAVQFEARLAYATEYDVSIAGVLNPALGQTSTITYRFTTASPRLYYLDRGESGAPDEIITTSLESTDRAVVYSAPLVQSFAAIDAGLAVVTLSGERESALDLVSADGIAVERVSLPGPAAIRELDAAESGSLIGFTLTSDEGGAFPEFSSTLMTLNLDGDRTVNPVLGLNGEPINVLGWEFVPGTTSLIALTRESSLILIDPTLPGAITPLGQYLEFGGISPDGSTVVVNDAVGSLAVSITDRTENRLVPSLIDGDVAFLGQTTVLSSGNRVSKLALFDAEGGRFQSVLAVDNGAQSQALFRTTNDAGSIEKFAISPNEQFVAVEVVPDFATAVLDGYLFDARYTTSTTVVIEIATGQVVRSLDGFGLLWR